MLPFLRCIIMSVFILSIKSLECDRDQDISVSCKAKRALVVRVRDACFNLERRSREDLSSISGMSISQLNWCRLLEASLDIINHMFLYNFSDKDKARFLSSRSHDTFVLLNSKEISATIQPFRERLQVKKLESSVISYTFDSLCSSGVDDALLELVEIENDINGMIITSTDLECISRVLTTVATNSTFKWRRFLHTTEWIVLTMDCSLEETTALPDFVTCISLSTDDDEVSVFLAQFSRTGGLRRRIPLSMLYGTSQTIENNSEDNPNSTTIDAFGEREHITALNNSLLVEQHVRSDAERFLWTQKSALAGLHLPVIANFETDKGILYNVTINNETTYRGLAIDVLDLLAETLDFTYTVMGVADGGGYGFVNEEGKLLGLTGYLLRREAAMSPNPIGTQPPRRDFIDFLEPPTTKYPFSVLYKVASKESQLMSTGVELLAAPQVWYFGVGGSVIAAIVGATLLLTRSALNSNEPILGYRNLRRLYNFPLHWVFQTVTAYHYQSERIFRATWAIFCVVIFATYKASITSSAAWYKEYPVLDSLDDLVEHTDYSIGVYQPYGYFMKDFMDAPPHTVENKVYKRIMELNQTDPMTLCTDLNYHINRVLQGNHVLMGAFMKTNILTLFQGDASDIRYNVLSLDSFYMSVPKHIFYKRDLERVLQTAFETGILQKIFDIHYPDEDSENELPDNEVVVHLESLFYLIYVMGLGVLVSTASLIVEKLLITLRICNVGNKKQNFRK